MRFIHEGMQLNFCQNTLMAVMSTNQKIANPLIKENYLYQRKYERGFVIE